MKNLLELFVPEEIEALYEYTGLAPMFEGWLDDTWANLIVAITTFRLDEPDANGEMHGVGPVTKALVERADAAGPVELGVLVFCKALDVPYEQVLGLVDGWAGKLDRDIDDPEEAPQYVKETGFYRCRELGESLRNEMVVISLRRDVEQLGLTIGDVRHLAGVSARSDIPETVEDAVIHMLTENDWEPSYIHQRFRHLSYGKGGGRLDFTDWRESGEPADVEAEAEHA